MTDVFESVTLAVKQFPFDPVLTDENKLQLYGLYKQATEGDAPSKCTSINPVARAKWNAWNQARGFSSDVAKDAYVEYANELMGHELPAKSTGIG